MTAQKNAAPVSPARKPEQSAHEEESTLEIGRQVFASRCAGCHGLDGRGTDRAPDIATEARAQRRTDADLRRTVRLGIPVAGMPAFSTMDDATVKSVVAYIRFLQGKRDNSSAKGDAQNGERLFFGKAGCANCHMVNGKGGFIALDLSALGRTTSAEEIRRAITSPGRSVHDEIMTVKTRDGRLFSGVLRNEDNFSLQLQELDGGFQLFLKADIEKIVRQEGSLMPTDYAYKLSSSEIEDLVSFVVRVGGASRKPAKGREADE
jgi:putative heme-binding domain-containing protein